MRSGLLLPSRPILVPKPKSYVKLDMAFGVGSGSTLFDKSRYRSHGTISGADWATGYHGYCLDFVAASKDYVEIAAAYTQLDFTSQDFSGIMRIYLDTVTPDIRLIQRGLRSTDGWFFNLFSGGRLAFETNQAAGRQYTYETVGTILASAWLTVGFSRKGTSVQLYNNGVVLSTTAIPHVNPATSARSTKIGIADDKSTEPLDGKIEFLRIFGGIALSTSEHLAWHNALA